MACEAEAKSFATTVGRTRFPGRVDAASNALAKQRKAAQQVVVPARIFQLSLTLAVLLRPLSAATLLKGSTGKSAFGVGPSQEAEAIAVASDFSIESLQAELDALEAPSAAVAAQVEMEKSQPSDAFADAEMDGDDMAALVAAQNFFVGEEAGSAQGAAPPAPTSPAAPAVPAPVVAAVEEEAKTLSLLSGRPENHA